MSVVACPKCHDQVTLPTKASKNARVRCPLCAEQYFLSDALAALPPMLEVLDDAGAAPIDAAPAQDDWDEPMPRVRHAQPVLAGVSRQDFGRSLADEDDHAPDLDLAGTATAVATAELDDLPAAEGELGTPTDDEPRLAEPSPLGPTPVKREHLHPPGTRKRKKAASPIGTLIAIMFGGALAIPCALLLLLWLPGDLRKDPFEVGPWLAKTAPFLVPADLAKGASSSVPKAAPVQVAQAKTGPRDTATAPSTNNSATAGGDANETPSLDFGDKFKTAAEKTAEKAQPAAIEPPAFPEVKEPEMKEPEIKDPTDPLAPNPAPFNPEVEASTPVAEANPVKLPEFGDEPKEEMKKDPVPEPTEVAAKPEVEVKPEATSKPEEPTTPAPTESEKPEADAVALAEKAFAKSYEDFQTAMAGEDRAAKIAAANSIYGVACALANALPSGASEVESPTLDAILSNQVLLGGMGQKAGGLIANAERKDDGIVLFGTVTAAAKEGDKQVLQVALPRDKGIVAVETTAAIAEGAKVLVAGKITSPAGEAKATVAAGWIKEAK